MKRIYLLRHAQPDFGGETHLCLGSRSNPPLSATGLAQAEELARCFASIVPCRIYSSPLLRAKQTAEIIARGKAKVTAVEELKELDCGEWDGLSFEAIREDYPEIYAKRGEDPSIPPPNGETFESGAERALRFVESLPDDENIIVVAHAGINRALLCSILGIEMKCNRSIEQAYACINVLEQTDGKLCVRAAGRKANDVPDILEMYGICGTGDNVIKHCHAVAETAIALAQKVRQDIDMKMLEHACLLHDMCRSESNHAQSAAKKLRAEGYMRLADIVASHHDCPTGGGLNEEKILFLADKLCDGEKRVTIDERFERSLDKCTTQQAIENHSKRWEQAKVIEEQYLLETKIHSISEVVL